jgi:hypothetical protein
MKQRSHRASIPVVVGLIAVVALISASAYRDPLSRDEPQAPPWSSLMDDGVPPSPASAAVRGPMWPATDAAMSTSPGRPRPARSCPGTPPPHDPSGDGGDCARWPLAFWTFDGCNALTTDLRDAAFTSAMSHPAFRAVDASCVEGARRQGVRLTAPADVIYAPDQPDFDFTRGLTIAAWINPDGLDGVQNIVRKRVDGSSSFVLALDGRALVFALRLADGQVAGVRATARVRAGRMNHVAATYDGGDILLYVDGARVARTRLRGTIAGGAGPILIGNDASGRQLRGVVDEIWLNDRAAPPDAIAGLPCVHETPLAVFTPDTSAPTAAGDSFPFDLAITNQNGASCAAEDISFVSLSPFGTTTEATSGTVTIASGATAHVAIVTTALRYRDLPPTTPVTYQVVNSVGDGTTAVATFVRATPGNNGARARPHALQGRGRERRNAARATALTGRRRLWKNG